MNDHDTSSREGLRGDLPVLVSFYGGDEYYHRSAERLRADCDALGMRHHIEERDVTGLAWPEICREKISFYGRMREQYGAFLWTDVDNRLLAVPEVLSGSRADFGGFIGRRKYLRDYDPYEVARFWIPAVLYFGSSEITGRFIDALGEREASTEEDVTDDWVLQETWRTFPEEMSLLVLPPSLLEREGDEEVGAAVFHIGDSGHVRDFRGKVAQHASKGADLQLRGKMLAAESRDAMKEGAREDALVLAEHAHRRLPDDSEAVLRLSNYLLSSGDLDRSDAVLKEFVAGHPGNLAVRDALVRRLSRRGEHDAVGDQLTEMLGAEEPRVIARAQALAYETELDRRAQESGESDRSRPSVWWARIPAPGHFAEVLKPWVVDQVVQGTPRFGRRQRALLTGEGSLATATESSVVWGSGLRDAEEVPQSGATYLAVRGPRTRRALLAAGGSCPETFGDPAQLLPELLPMAKPARRRHYLGFFRGAGDLSTSVVLDGVHEIDPVGTPPGVIERVVEEFLHCRGILTTSLAGLVAAHAYGIPARWCTLGSGPAETDGEDFRDYFDAVGLAPQEPLDLSTLPAITRDLLREVPSLKAAPPVDPTFSRALSQHYVMEVG
ncbi:hypothetical protein CFK41_02440 [Brachybacterium ginsengisoli]|uniref:Tetratricopeptide repeat protein n=1 Tax=Brachybacterium ginsengisoli TaxID=1331682 RepID=A0A291GUA6_9MICO|nr:hypothetical protein [Brachybacterium ginsengisoli]ATG53760.1 hypothetical protein CFK41_02440 [Brachybacterium ginsengisoli]